MPFHWSHAMRFTNQLSVVHVTSADEDKPVELREAIRDYLRSGLNVLVLCRQGMRRRVARMALAMSKTQQEFPESRLAVVTPSVNDFTESLPSVVVDQVKAFESAGQAIHWLNLEHDADAACSTVVWDNAV
jgi:hypothetical protein